ncbi:class A beta-lactamase [Staphylococcus sp. ACRSN]|uniref:class A beta-lactamase n=1 Tax=Staphylococcus sp. ACRSN TaxID=2918214 RepID=UPI001EF27C02|nr:class A beta-lactamase [Staphylococcus sp. ACRSN]MCG7339234.1 class A beta-lactamase [Staphylococcus sp. ACRSN]
MKRILVILLLAILTILFKTESAEASGDKSLNDLEKKYDTTIGVYGINTKNDIEINHHSDDRFAFASTYKAIASGILLERMTPQELNKKIAIHQSDIVTYSPVTEKYVGKSMTIKSLIEASMLKSDNTANNKIIQELGGISSFKYALRQLGDGVSEPQRLEPDLNNYNPNNIADTTTPRAAAKNLNQILTQSNMHKSNLQFLKKLMIENETGDSLIKAGISDDFVVGDKSGQGTTYATRNDLAFIYPKGEDKPIILAIYTKQHDKNGKPNDEVIEKAAKVAIHALDK